MHTPTLENLGSRSGLNVKCSPKVRVLNTWSQLVVLSWEVLETLGNGT
jgi:hypothetical protein